MELTTSWEGVLPDEVRHRFEIREVRNASAILEATAPEEFADALAVLSSFTITFAQLMADGGNKSQIAAGLDEAFRVRGWREGRHDTHLKSVLRIQPYRPAGESKEVLREYSVENEGYKVDNVKGRVALDVEWNAKDGNLDRDVGAYRALYDGGIIDAGILVVRDYESIRDLALSFGAKKYSGTTTTTLTKLTPRLTRGDGGGCPILALGITDRCFDRSSVPSSRT